MVTFKLTDANFATLGGMASWGLQNLAAVGNYGLNQDALNRLSVVSSEQVIWPYEAVDGYMLTAVAARFNPLPLNNGGLDTPIAGEHLDRASLRKNLCRFATPEGIVARIKTLKLPESEQLALWGHFNIDLMAAGFQVYVDKEFVLRTLPSQGNKAFGGIVFKGTDDDGVLHVDRESLRPRAWMEAAKWSWFKESMAKALKQLQAAGHIPAHIDCDNFIPDGETEQLKFSREMIELFRNTKPRHDEEGVVHLGNKPPALRIEQPSASWFDSVVSGSTGNNTKPPPPLSDEEAERVVRQYVRQEGAHPFVSDVLPIAGNVVPISDELTMRFEFPPNTIELTSTVELPEETEDPKE